MANYTTILEQISKPGVIDSNLQRAVYGNNALLWAITGKPDYKNKKDAIPKFQEEEDGGTGYFETFVLLEENANITWRSRTEGLSVTEIDLGDRTKVPVQSIVGTIPVYDYDLDLNNVNRNRVVKLLTAVIEQAQATASNLMAAGIYAAGTGYAGKEFYGAQYWLPNTVTSGSIAGIDQATKTNWRSYVKNGGTDSFATYAVNYISALIDNTVYGRDMADLLTFNVQEFSRLKAILQAYQRVGDTEEYTKMGFRNLEYGGATCLLDGNETAGVIHAFCSSVWELAFIKGCNMKIGSFIEPVNEQYRAAKLTIRGNAVCKNRKPNGKIYSFGTA
jgi:hypothetical protein